MKDSVFREVVSAVTNDPDRAWEVWGKENPYYGVHHDPKFLNENLDDERLQEFFAGGESHVDHVCQVIRQRIRADFAPQHALDYGCGVGRLVVGFAQRMRSVTGIDISPSMLNEAKENCRKLGITTVDLLHVDDMAKLAPGSFDFIHSFIVFQHIPTNRGEMILAKLLSLLADGGVGALQFTYADMRRSPADLVRHAVFTVRKHVGVVHGLVNLMRGLPYSWPLMQMNSYSLSRIFEILISFKCQNVYVEFSDHGGYRGAMIYFEKAPKLVL